MNGVKTKHVDLSKNGKQMNTELNSDVESLFLRKNYLLLSAFGQGYRFGYI